MAPGGISYGDPCQEGDEVHGQLAANNHRMWSLVLSVLCVEKVL